METMVVEDKLRCLAPELVLSPALLSVADVLTLRLTAIFDEYAHKTQVSMIAKEWNDE
jgi:hypothetical protein